MLQNNSRVYARELSKPGTTRVLGERFGKALFGGWRTRTESIQKLILLTCKEVTDFFFKPSTQLLFEPQAIKLIRTLVLPPEPQICSLSNYKYLRGKNY